MPVPRALGRRPPPEIAAGTFDRERLRRPRRAPPYRTPETPRSQRMPEAGYSPTHVYTRAMAVETAPSRLREDPEFRRFWAARVVSLAGSSFTYVALPVLIYRRTG